MGAILIMKDNYTDEVYGVLDFDSVEKRERAIQTMDKVRETIEGWSMEDIWDALYELNDGSECYGDVEDYYL